MLSGETDRKGNRHEFIEDAVHSQSISGLCKRVAGFNYLDRSCSTCPLTWEDAGTGTGWGTWCVCSPGGRQYKCTGYIPGLSPKLGATCLHESTSCHCINTLREMENIWVFFALHMETIANTSVKSSTYTRSFVFLQSISPLWCFLCSRIFTVVSEAPLRLSLLRLRPRGEALTLGGVARSDRALLCSPEHWSTECLFCKHRYNEAQVISHLLCYWLNLLFLWVIAEGTSSWITAHIADFFRRSHRVRPWSLCLQWYSRIRYINSVNETLQLGEQRSTTEQSSVLRSRTHHRKSQHSCRADGCFQKQPSANWKITMRC